MTKNIINDIMLNMFNNAYMYYKLTFFLQIYTTNNNEKKYDDNET